MIHTGNIRVHQVVCTAFHGPEPHPHMVVDHIDTNRCNNRPENLRWLTRLENALMNEATRKKIIYLCGSIEAFIKDPSILRTKALPPSISWMKTVTKEQAIACKKRIDEWTLRDSKVNSSSGKGIGDWIYNPLQSSPQKQFNDKSKKQRGEEIAEIKRESEEKRLNLKDSLTQGAKQMDWKTPSEFPLIPLELSSTPLMDYLSNLKKGSIFTRNQWSEQPIYDAAIAEDKSHLAVITKISGIANFALAEVTFTDGCFIHKSIRTFSSEEGAQKYFAISLGREWTGGDVLEDYC
ncbi:MAG: HNH endonuclease [Duncaniella sp.]|nr:HNH endonuclease [Duncaniella sp.]